MKKLFILDSNSLLYKAYYAIQNLTDSKGNSTNAVYGFCRMFLKIIKDFSPYSVIAVFDVSKKTFRSELYTEYKAQRPPMPDDMVPQIKQIKEFLNIMGVPVIGIQNFEADDIIGSLAAEYKDKYEINIVSGDKDLNQLIDENVFILNTKKGITDIIKIDRNIFEEKYLIKLEQFIDYLALIGDTSDNVPGVKGIGPKTAQNLLGKYKELDNIYKNIDLITPKGVNEKLRTDKDNAFLSRELVTIKTDIETDIEILPFNIEKINELYDFFSELEFSSLIKELGIENSKQSSDEIIKNREILCVNGVKEIDEPIENKLYVYNAVLNETETVYICSENKIFYFNADDKNLIKLFYDIIIKNKLTVAGYDLKKILKLFLGADLDIFLLKLDDYRIIDAVISKDKELEKIFYDFFKLEIKIDNLKFEQVDLFTTEFTENLQSEIIKFFHYYTKLYDCLKNKLDELNQTEVYENIEQKLLSVISEIEFNGIRIDDTYLKHLDSEIKIKIEKIRESVFEKTGHEFNLNSPKQIAEVLFEEFKLEPLKKIKTGFSTDNTVLEKLALEHEIPQKILEYRKYDKIKNTYIEPLIMHQKNDKRIHATFNQTGTSTGRFSCSDPNLQNLPNSREDVVNIRKAFIVSGKNKIFVSADYSQIELRILAHLCDDSYMIDAFKKGMDIHKATAVKVFGIPENFEITSEMRRIAKIINFGVLYGMTAHRLSNELDIPFFKAKNFIDNYFKTFSSIQAYFDNIIETGKKNGYVETLFGRRRYIPELKAKNKNVFNSGSRMAINMPVQGTAADILKLAMIRIKEKNKFNAECVSTIHDELIFEVDINEKKDFMQFIKNEMENIVELKVPLTVNPNSGFNLSELK